MRPEAITVPALDVAPQRFFNRATGREFRARASDGATVIEIFDEIGPYGIGAKDIADALRGEGDVVVRLNSPGGSVFEGITAFNLLQKHPGNVRVEVLGIAASAASLIAMAGDTVAMASNAMLMVHRAWTLVAGNEQDFEETAAILRQIDGSLAKTYAQRSGQSEAAMRKMLEAETWFDADAAIDTGLADRKLEAAPVKARFDLSVYNNVPDALSAEIGRADIQTIRDLEAVLRDAGLSRSQARAMASRGFNGETETQREAEELAQIAALIQDAASSFR